MIKRIINIIVVLLFIYIVVGVLLYFIQDRFLLHPKKLKKQYRFAITVPHQELNIPVNQEDTINIMKFLPASNKPRGVVLYFHGNRENIEHYVKYTNRFTSRGYEVWMEDYPGFGKSTGERTEKKMYQQALQVQKMAAAKYGKDSIIVYGKSFGTGIAAYVASESKNQRLILETPYYSIPSLFNCYAPIYPTGKMSNYQIPAYKYLSAVHYPITIFHGTDDGVIPYRNAARLKKIIKPADEFVTVEGGTHHNLNDFDLVKKKLDSLLSLR